MDFSKSPRIGRGRVAFCLILSALMPSGLLGVLVPTTVDIKQSGIILDQPGYSGNAGTAVLISCLNHTSGLRHCAPNEGFDNVANAMAYVVDELNSSYTTQPERSCT